MSGGVRRRQRVAQLLAGWLALATVATGEEEDEEGEEGAEWTVTVCYHTGLDCQDESPICIDRTSDDEDGLGTCSSVQVCGYAPIHRSQPTQRSAESLRSQRASNPAQHSQPTSAAGQRGQPAHGADSAQPQNASQDMRPLRFSRLTKNPPMCLFVFVVLFFSG